MHTLSKLRGKGFKFLLAKSQVIIVVKNENPRCVYDLPLCQKPLRGLTLNFETSLLTAVASTQVSVALSLLRFIFFLRTSA